jgi:hypothetical protein
MKNEFFGWDFPDEDILSNLVADQLIRKSEAITIKRHVRWLLSGTIIAKMLRLGVFWRKTCLNYGHTVRISVVLLPDLLISNDNDSLDCACLWKLEDDPASVS